MAADATREQNVHFMGRLTFDMRGGRQQAKPDVGRPLDGRVRLLHRTSAALKCGFSIMLRRLPNGSVTAATLIPWPTSVTGSSSVAPSASSRSNSAFAFATPQ